MTSRWLTLTLASLLTAATVASAQDEPMPPEGGQAPAKQQTEDRLLGRTIPNMTLIGLDRADHQVGPQLDKVQVIYVFSLDSDMQTNWYEPWQGKNEAVIPTLKHLQKIYADALGKDEQLPVFSLVVKTFEPTYGAKPGGAGAKTDKANGPQPLDVDRLQAIERIRSDAQVDFNMLDAEPSVLVSALQLKRNVVLVLDAQGKICFAAREGRLKGEQMDYLAEAIRQVQAGETVTCPTGAPHESGQGMQKGAQDEKPGAQQGKQPDAQQ